MYLFIKDTHNIELEIRQIFIFYSKPKPSRINRRIFLCKFILVLQGLRWHVIFVLNLSRLIVCPSILPQYNSVFTFTLVQVIPTMTFTITCGAVHRSITRVFAILWICEKRNRQRTKDNIRSSTTSG